MKLKQRVLFIVIIITLSITAKAQQPNILFIAVDDLNCDFNAYGNEQVISPNLDKLAAEGTIFTNNHCPQAVCGASRASILSGWMPQKSGITGFRKYLRDLYPNMVTIPLFFKNKGYQVEGMGKIHDYRNVSEFNNDTYDKISWNTFFEISGSRYFDSEGNPPTENKATNDTDYKDGVIAEKAVERISALAANSEPFFLAVGFYKPHLPFTAPTKYWDMYNRSELKLAEFTSNAANDHEGFYNYGSEFRNSYDGFPAEGDFSEELRRELKHGYYACISYADAQVGKLIDALKASGEYDNTIIVFWGDHGFHLGDHSMWGKHTNFEQATRSPLMIKAPGYKTNNISNAPTGLIDIFPTLCDLAGYEIPADKDGNSLKPLLSDASNDVNNFTVSRFSRDGYSGNAYRDRRYRYVEWVKGDDVKLQLFDYKTDTLETENKAYLTEYKYLVDSFTVVLNRYLDSLIAGDFNFGFEHLNDANEILNWKVSKQNNGEGNISANEVSQRTGNYCLAIENTNAGEIQDVGATLIPNYETELDFKVAFYAKGAEGSKIRLSIIHNYLNDEKKYSNSQAFVLSSEYQRFEASFEKKPSANNEPQISIVPRFQVGATGGTYFIDDVEITTSGTTSIKGNRISSNIKVYPNPVSDILTVQNLAIGSRYKIYNSVGKVVKVGEFKSETDTVDVSLLKVGYYLLEVKKGESVTVNKILKQ